MTKTLIDIEDAWLDEARAVLGTSTKRDTVNRALREAVGQGAIQAFVRETRWRPNEAAAGLVLADVSALVGCAEPAVAARLLPLLVLRDLATCAAVKHDLAALDGESVTAALAALRAVKLHWLRTDDVDLAVALDIQTELICRGQPQLPWSRLVIAAVAGRHSAAVLHYASDYDLIAKVTGQDTQWVAAPGTLPEHVVRPMTAPIQPGRAGQPWERP
jgi:predicted nucleic acid-binding protein